MDEQLISTDRDQLARQRTALAVERNRMAAERTFSAWLRTGLTGVAGGLAIVKFVTFRQESHQLIAYWVGDLLILWGIFIFIVALSHYNRTCITLEVIGKRRDDRFGTWKARLIVFMLIILSILIFTLTTLGS